MKLDAKAKSEIAKSWSLEFPTLQIWKPMRLLRRNGPLLLGISLEGCRSNDQYTPRAHFHNLCTAFPNIALELVGEVETRGVPRRIDVKNHQRDYKVLARELLTKFPFLGVQCLDFNAFIQASRDYLEGKHGKIGRVPFQHAPLEGVIKVALFMGQLEYAREALDEFAARISEWPEHGLNIIQSAEQWKQGMKALIDSPQKVRETVEEQIKEHRLQDLPNFEFVWPAKPEKLFDK